MLRWLICGFLFLNGMQCNAGQDIVNYKQTISEKQTQIANATQEQKSRLLKELAILHYKDQEKEKAFLAYLQALKLAPLLTNIQKNDLDDNLYQEALQEYLSQDNQLVQTKYSSILKEHPEYYQVGYVVAATDANLSKFPEFFELFYQSYCHLPEHYLAYKGLASLHAQLYALSRKPEDREMHRVLIIENVQKAIEKYPKDTSLYKMLLVFSKQNKKVAAITDCIKKIIKNDCVIPRDEIGFYTRQATDLKQFDLAQQFISKCKEWYPNSRLVHDTEQCLKEIKKQ